MILVVGYARSDGYVGKSRQMPSLIAFAFRLPDNGRIFADYARSVESSCDATAEQSVVVEVG